MVYKRIIYSLLYSKGFFHLSRNFRLQQVGDVEWLKNNFGFGETCDYIDELMITLVTKNPDKNEINNYFKDVKKLKEKIFVPIILGGGIRTFDQAKNCFSAAAKNRENRRFVTAPIPSCSQLTTLMRCE